jgi:hypothetical protein
MSLPDTMPAGNFDYAALAKAVALAVPPVSRVRVEPWHVLQHQQLDVADTLPVEVRPIGGQLGVILRADPANSGTVYVGTDAMVGAGDYPLAKGDTLTVSTDAALFLIASGSGQLVYVIAGGC